MMTRLRICISDAVMTNKDICKTVFNYKVYTYKMMIIPVMETGTQKKKHICQLRIFIQTKNQESNL